MKKKSDKLSGAPSRARPKAKIKSVMAERSFKPLLGVLEILLEQKKLWRIKRSYGSILLLDFGDKLPISSENKARTVGEWVLLINIATWAIKKSGDMLISSRRTAAEIDAMLNNVKLWSIESAKFRATGDLEILFSGGEELSVQRANGRKFDIMWILYHRNSFSLSATYKNQVFELSLKARGARKR